MGDFFDSIEQSRVSDSLGEDLGCTGGMKGVLSI
jgi:hypothetical protein